MLTGCWGSQADHPEAKGHATTVSNSPVLAVCAALVRDGKMLLGKRLPDKPLDPLKWSLFGGHVMPGEPHEAAIRRELHEELGIEAAEVHCIGTLPELDDEQRYLTDVYVVSEWSGEPENLQEHVAIRWVAPADFDSLDLSPGLVEIIERLGLLEVARDIEEECR